MTDGLPPSQVKNQMFHRLTGSGFEGEGLARFLQRA
jgi:hypothetical protein